MDLSKSNASTIDYFSNVTVDNQTVNNATIAVFALGPPLVISSSVCIVIGTIFSILCIVRYWREPALRTHYNYIFHFMLIYCLLSAVISTPIFLIGYYMDLFKDSPALCNTSTVNYLTINMGMVTSLAYASIERHFFIFRKNGQLTWHRQFFPVFCLLAYSYMIATLFTILPTCTYIPCVPCQTTSFHYMVPWLILSFFLPQCIMILSTVYLLYRLREQRAIVNRRVEWLVARKIVLQMSFYVIWSCLYYCPVTFYNLTLLFNPSRYSAELKSMMNILNTVCVQSYPVLTFISMFLFVRRREEQKRKDSKLKLHNLLTITTPRNGVH